MADALAARQQGIGELQGGQIKIALHLFKPFQRVARRRLQAQHFHPPLVLIPLKRALQCGFRMQVFRQGNRAIERQARPRPDGKMPRRRRIAHQHDVFMIPTRTDHARKLHPNRRPTQVRCVRHQRMAAQMLGENLLAGRDGFFFRHLGKTQPVPCIRQAFDDEGRGVFVELVNMGPNPAMFGFFEDKGEGVVELGMGAQPDEFAFARVNIGLKHLRIIAPHNRVDAIGRHDQIVFFAIFFSRFELCLKLQIHAQFAGPRLQQDQHRLAPDARKAVPA